VLPAERFIEIDYEGLVSDPEPVIRRMLAACGLAWDPVCLRPDLNRHVVKTPSKWQARQPIYRTAVERWRTYEPWLGPLRALLT
jgi:LPS sulfotransferase NodH